MRIPKFALAIAGLAALSLSAQNAPRAPLYDPTKEITIHGTVSDVLIAQHGTLTGVHLTVKTADAVLDVRLGPAWFLQQRRFAFQKGEELTVTGATLTLDGKPMLIAREVKKAGAVLVLRDSNGYPLWAGRGRRQTW